MYSACRGDSSSNRNINRDESVEKIGMKICQNWGWISQSWERKHHNYVIIRSLMYHFSNYICLSYIVTGWLNITPSEMMYWISVYIFGNEYPQYENNVWCIRVYFTDTLSIVIELWWTFHFVLIPILMNWLLQDFAHVSRPVAVCVSSDITTRNGTAVNGIAIEFKLNWKIL